MAEPLKQELIGAHIENVEVTGNLWGGGTVSATLALGGFSFTTFAFDASWSNLASVVLNGVGAGCCGSPPGNYYAIDNVAVETAAVPEPLTLSLLALGSASLLARRRRNAR